MSFCIANKPDKKDDAKNRGIKMFRKLMAGFLLAGCLFTFSEMSFAQDATVYVGSKHSNKYHYTWSLNPR